MRVHKIEIPKIPEEEKTPIILRLLEIIGQQSETIILQAEEIQQLKDEIARLKKQKPKPKIRPSRLEKSPQDQKRKEPSWKRPGSEKRSKTSETIIHKTIRIAPEFIPPGSTFKGYQTYTMQGIKIEPYNIRYLKVSDYINVYDTGARHNGKNGYCTHIGPASCQIYTSYTRGSLQKAIH